MNILHFSSLHVGILMSIKTKCMHVCLFFFCWQQAVGLERLVSEAVKTTEEEGSSSKASSFAVCAFANKCS